jgi:hypothetical protein
MAETRLDSLPPVRWTRDASRDLCLILFVPSDIMRRSRELSTTMPVALARSSAIIEDEAP